MILQNLKNFELSLKELILKINKEKSFVVKKESILTFLNNYAFDCFITDKEKISLLIIEDFSNFKNISNKKEFINYIGSLNKIIYQEA